MLSAISSPKIIEALYEFYTFELLLMVMICTLCLSIVFIEV